MKIKLNDWVEYKHQGVQMAGSVKRVLPDGRILIKSVLKSILICPENVIKVNYHGDNHE